MLQVYGIRLPEILTEQDMARLRFFAAPAVIRRVAAFRCREDAARILTGDLLRRRIIGQRLSQPPRQLQFVLNAYGKPFLAAGGVEFNLSHSGGWVVCAVSDQPVGIDVEEIRPVERDVAAYCFSPTEQEWLAMAGVSWLDRFYQLWTLKESYVKALGQGLSRPLTSFALSHGVEQGWSVKSETAAAECFFCQYDLEARYKMAVCARRAEFPPAPAVLSLEELLQSFLPD